MAIRIVLVDDNARIRLRVRRVLEMESDIEVVAEAASGDEALSLTKVHQPDVVVMDIAMAGMSGMEATRRLREAHLHLPVIALSMHSDASYVRGMLEAGAIAYVVKDNAAEELADAIHSALAGKPFLGSGLPEVFSGS